MPLMVARPWKHPKTGIYWLRRGVPDDLRTAVGKREEKRSLRTRDAIEAKRLHAEALAELEVRWASLKAGPRAISEIEAHAIAEPMFDWWLSQYRDEPSSQTFWPLDLGPKLFAPPKRFFAGSKPSWDISDEDMRISLLEAWCDGNAAELIKAKGLVLDDLQRRKLAIAVGKAVQRASEVIDRLSRGESLGLTIKNTYSNAALPHLSEPVTSGKRTEHVPIKITELFELWWAEAQAVGKTRSTYTSYAATLRAFGAFLKHDDAARVRTEDVIGFKDFRLASLKPNGKPISPTTVKNSDLAALKSIFGWAVTNRKLQANPALGVKVQKSASVRYRDPGFKGEEVKRLLTAALNVKRGKETPQTFAAKRWIPWLLAFTGARVGEVAQLRKSDIRHEALDGYPDGVWVLAITPEAGSVKVKKARDVPIHPQLVEQGFIRFVEACQTDRLFLRPDSNGGVSGPLRGLKNRLQASARVEVGDPNVSPNHGWRHRFRSVATEAGVADSLIDALGGWKPPTVGGRYGEKSLRARTDAIWRLPGIKTD